MNRFYNFLAGYMNNIIVILGIALLVLMIANYMKLKGHYFNIKSIMSWKNKKSSFGFEFIWVTDGGGWKSARKNPSETFDVLETLYNINDMEEGALGRLFRYGEQLTRTLN